MILALSLGLSLGLSLAMFGSLLVLSKMVHVASLECSGRVRVSNNGFHSLFGDLFGDLFGNVWHSPDLPGVQLGVIYERFYINFNIAINCMGAIGTWKTIWKQGTTYWKKLTQEEFEQLEDERDAQIESGKINTPARRTCSDKGKKRKARAHDEDSDPEEHSHSNKRKKTSRRSRNSDDAGVGASRADSDNETDGEYKPNSTDKHPTVSQHQQANRCAKSVGICP
ncbi:hypothetical protein F5887DRAFT_918040 [Amanita rubescens]|nr:hypothetical protein F5887DRAFT_918040 [Amanita rubescens]